MTNRKYAIALIILLILLILNLIFMEAIIRGI